MEYPIAVRGGVGIIVETLAGALHDRMRLTLVSPDSKDQFGAHPVAKWIQDQIQWGAIRHSKHTANDLAHKILKAKPDLVHFHFGGNYGWGNHRPGSSAIPLLARSGVPVLSTVHSVVDLMHGHTAPTRPWWFKALSLPVAQFSKSQCLKHHFREVAVSKHDITKLRKWFPAHAARFQHIYHSRLSGGPVIGDPQKRKPAVLFVGHVARRKGQHVLARAFAKVAADFPKWELWFAGDVAEESAAKEVRDIAADHGLSSRVSLHGPRNDIPDLLNSASVYAQSSLEEALGLALQEAMWHGLPCVGSDVGGIPELIDHGRTGLLVPPDNPGALAAVLADLMKNAQKRAEFGTAGAQSILAKGMTRENMVAENLKLYESALIH